MSQIRMSPCLSELLAVGRPPEHVVALHEAGTESWSDFSARIKEAGLAVTSEARSRVLLKQSDPIDFLAHLLAALTHGLTPVIPPNFQPATLAEISTALDDDGEPIAQTLELFTSGSSGRPKRVVKRLAQLEAECRALEALWGGQLGNAIIVSTVPHHHIYGLLFRLLWPLLAGRAFDNLTAGEPSQIQSRLDSAQTAALVSSPAQLSRMPELHDLSKISPPILVFSSGGPLPAGTSHTFRQFWKLTPTEIYGSTETGGIAWREQDGNSTSWTCLPGVQVTTDVDGALLIRSPFLANDQPVRSDDRGELLADGSFVLSGRMDRVVKIEEKRLSLPDLEQRLAAHPWVEQAAAAAIRTGSGRRTVIGALIVLTREGRHEFAHGRRAVTQALSLHLGQHFDHVLWPKRWRFTDRLPYNERGKLRDSDVAALLTSPIH